MKNILKLLLAMSVIFPVESCTTNFIYKQFGSDYVLPEERGEIILDRSYKFYVRAVLSEEQEVAGTDHKQRVLGLLKAGNGKDGDETKGGKVIEIEYLWISETQHTVVYISTIADQFQNRYSHPSFLGLDKPNAADFRIFFIGKIDADRLVFYGRDGKHTDNWTISENPNEVVLRTIKQKRFGESEETFVLDEALHSQMLFKKWDRWQLMFLGKKDKIVSHAVPLVNNTLHYAVGGKRYGLMLDFTDCKVVFPESHIIYTPERKIAEEQLSHQKH
jgi:hypothetical protein